MIETAELAGLVTCPSPLRWAGGKRKLLPLLHAAVGALPVGRIVEPFMGGGSVLLGTAAREAAGSDINLSLMTFFRQCRDNLDEVIDVLSEFADTKEHYYAARSSTPSSEAAVAARFIYLNRTSYMGLHRTNLKGDFNVPYGGGGRYDFEALGMQLSTLSARLYGVELRDEGFGDALARVGDGDVVFLDPPYGVAGDLPFRRYGAALFSLLDHFQLAADAGQCVERGARVFITLPASPALLENYPDWDVLAERRTRDGSLTEVCLTSNEVERARLTPIPLKGQGGWKLPSESPRLV